MAKILITGGAGYIGSHTAVELLNEGYEVVVYDNLYNSSEESIKRVEELTGKTVKFYEGDILDADFLRTMFEMEKIDAVIHCAALKAVGESVRKPLEYYQNNITGTLTLLGVMREVGVKNIVFSSSATIYGTPAFVPITEACPKGICTNPYGWTKLMNEQILTDATMADPELSVVLLRYFNPIGAHESGLLGENPNDIPNNLMPFITQVAIGKREYLGVFGDDYETSDGTGVRDYIHVCDLAYGHVLALDKLFEGGGVLKEEITSTVAIGSVTVGKRYPVGTSLEDIIRDILVQYKTPAVAITLTPDTTLYDVVSETLPTTKITANVIKQTSEIAKVDFYVGSELGVYRYSYKVSIPQCVFATFAITLGAIFVILSISSI